MTAQFHCEPGPRVIFFTTSHESPSSCRRMKKQQQLKLALPINMEDNNADIREKTEQKVAAFHDPYSGNGVMTKRLSGAAFKNAILQYLLAQQDIGYITLPKGQLINSKTIIKCYTLLVKCVTQS